MLLHTSLFILTHSIMSISRYCSHPIFCNDQVLTKVAQSNYFEDSKTFVDLILKVPVEEALKKFNELGVQQFIKACFEDPDQILETTDLKDWRQNPQFLEAVKDPLLLKFARELNKRWKLLARKVNLSYSEGECKEDCSSFLPEMHGRTIIIPGGRFRESYYWDSYWIIKGLIVCDMTTTAQGLVQNFILMVEKYGMIPNGFRQYFLNRSQPPFLALMVKDLSLELEKKSLHARARSLEERAFHSLIQEHEFFMNSHSKTYKLKSGKEIQVNCYNAKTTTPRPESYQQDLKLVENQTKSERERILKGVSSMAESGWDFSTRWFSDPSDMKTNIINEMIPSDLNTLMALSEEYIISLCQKFKREDLVPKYFELLNDRRSYFTEIFSGSSFPDFILKDNTKRSNIFPSDYYPFLLFTTKKADISEVYHDTVNPVSSFIKSGQQWDSPNVWAPNNWILHEVVSSEKALQLAQEWVSTTYCSWKGEGLIYQKYRNDQLGMRGEGGEYGVQSGFGWTNGLALMYLSLYGSQLVAPDC